MVATIKVIQRGAKSVSKYFGLMGGVGDYYTEQAHSEWHGNAARLLGLEGTINQRDFENLLTGRGPAGQPLGRIRADSPDSKRKRVPGYDITLSVPKSISILWAIGCVRVQYVVIETLLMAARLTIGELESDLPLARRGRGGKTEINAGLVVGMFLHKLSRANDPQLHVHCIIANACFGSDKQWSAVNSRKVHEFTMTLGGIFRSHLCRELEQRLNVSYRDVIGRDGSIADWKEVAEIPKSLIDHFSQRRTQIKRAVGEDRIDDSAARQRANFATRAAKNEPDDQDILRDLWRTEASRHGIDWEQLSDSLADQTVNPSIVVLRDQNREQSVDKPLFESESEGHEVPLTLEATLKDPELQIEASESSPEQPSVNEEAIEESTATDQGVEKSYHEETPNQFASESIDELTVQPPPTESVNTTAEGPLRGQPIPEKQTAENELPDRVSKLKVDREARTIEQNDSVPGTECDQPNGGMQEKVPESVFRPQRILSKKEEAIYDKQFSETAQKLAGEKAYYSASEFTAALGKKLRKDGVEVPHLINRVRSDLQQRKEIVVLPNTQRPLYSSRSYFEKETSLVEDARSLRQCKGARVDLRLAEKYSHRLTQLSTEQARAAFHVLTQTSGLKMITTASGSGHEKTLLAVREAFEKSGYEVVGTALSGRTSSALEKSTGIPSRTVASWLYHLDRSELRTFTDAGLHEAKMFGRRIGGKGRWNRSDIRLPRGGVLVVEQAGMIDTHGMSRLIHHAKKVNCTVILAGDPAQLQPIGVGGPLEYLQHLAGHAELTQHERQESVADRFAVDALRDNRPEVSLQEYDHRGRFRVSENPEESLVEEWAQSGATRCPQDHMILTPTRKLQDLTNSLCQQERLANRSLSGPGIRHGGQRYYIGDRIRFNRSQRRKGINTGDTGTVTGINPLTRSINVRLDEPPSDESKKRYGARQTTTVSLLATEKTDLSLNYAATTHRVHGGECDHVWVLVDGGRTTSELAYSQISHGKKSTRLFAHQRSDEPEKTRVADEWSISHKKDLAHDKMSQIDLNLEQ